MSLLAVALGVARLAFGIAMLGLWGWALAHWLLKGVVDSTERTGIAFGLAVGSVGVLGYAAWALGLPLDAVVLATLVLGVVGLAEAARHQTRLRWREDTKGALRWAGFAAVAAALQGIWLSDSADMFYHLAAVWSLISENRPLVTDLMLAKPPPGGLDPTSGIWPTLLAVLCRFSGLDPVTVIRWFTPALAAVIAATFLAMVRRTVGPRGRAAAMILMLVVAFMLDFRWAVYPNRIGLAVAAAALLGLVVHAEHGGRGSLAVAAVLVGTVAAMHLVTFELLAIAVATYALVVAIWGRTAVGEGAYDRARVVGACLAALAVGGAIAYTKIAPAIGSLGFRVGNIDRLVDVRAQIPTLGFGPLALMAPGKWLQGSILLFPGAVGVAVALILDRPPGRRTGELMAAALALVMPVVAFNLFGVRFAVDRLWYHVARVGFIWPIFLGIPAGALYARLTEKGGTSWWRQLSLALLVAGILVTGARWGALVSGPRDLASFWHSRAYDLGWAWREHAPALRGRLGVRKGDVVAAPLGLSYHVAGLMPVRVIGVASAHMPYYAERLEGAKRRHDVFRLLSSSIGKHETREILDRYGVTWIMTWTDERGRLLPSGARHLDLWPDVAVPTYRAGGLAVFRVRRAT